jgi:hypothetical protein
VSGQRSDGPGSDGPGTVGDVVAAVLEELGVVRVHGLPLGGLRHVPVADWDLAVLLADADGRLGGPDGHGRLGAALLPGPVLHLSSAPGGRSPLRTVGSVEELLEVLVGAPGRDLPAATAVHLDLDLSAPAPAGPLERPRGDRVPLVVLDPSMAGLRLLLVAGPGVVRSGATAELRDLARHVGAPVLSTFGALGVEPPDSPYHAGVAGLQARDLELGGLGAADVVLATGLDPDEVPEAALAAGPGGALPVLEVPPGQLGELARRWTGERPGPPDRPSQRSALAPVLTPLVESSAEPLPAARAAVLLAGAVGATGVAVADPGAAGFWVARCFPAYGPGRVLVPATAEPGLAAAVALVAALEGRRCVAVTDPVGAAAPATGAVLELARSLGSSPRLQVWGADGPALGTEAFVDLLSPVDDGPRVDAVGIDLDLPSALVEAAGPLVAWGGPAGGGTAPHGGDGAVP